MPKTNKFEKLARKPSDFKSAKQIPLIESLFNEESINELWSRVVFSDLIKQRPG